MRCFFFFLHRNTSSSYRKRISSYRVTAGLPASQNWAQKEVKKTAWQRDRRQKKSLKRVLMAEMFCRTQSTSLTLWFSSFSRLPSGRRIPHFCEKKSILCRISIDEAGKQCSIAILFLFVHSPQTTIAKWNNFTLNPAQWSGIQCAKKSERLTGIRSHPRTSLKHPHTNLAMTHSKKMSHPLCPYTLCSVHPPFQFLFFKATPVCNLSWKASHKKTLSLRGILFFQSFFSLLLLKPV